MLNNVFTKYISVFMLILLLSFLMLTTILTSLVTAYNTDVKMNAMADAAYSLAVYLQSARPQEDAAHFEESFAEQARFITPVVDLLSVNVDDLTLRVVSEDGIVLYTGGSGQDTATADVPSGTGATLPESVALRLIADGYISEKGTLDGFFKTEHCTYGIALEDKNGEVYGAVIAATSSAGMSELLEAMNKTVLMSTLWIMLAALVAVYFMTERMVAPLRSMSRAAKAFANRQFDARVPVTGSDEIAELAVAFNKMAESLAVLDETQRSFVANVSHDLRTPMTTISGFIDGILNGAIPPEKHEYYLGIVSSEVRRLSRLVSALLDLSRMQAGERKFTMVSFDVCELARQILISFEQRIEEKHLDVSFDCDSDRMDVLADRDAIYQVLYNICDNAVKFSAEGGSYRIAVAEKDKKIAVSVYNSGTGIPKEDLPHIFDRFYKSDKSRGLDKTGAGLGMHISRAIIESHGEKIWVESEYGQWCRFTFTLPRAPQRTVFSAGENKIQDKKGE